MKKNLEIDYEVESLFDHIFGSVYWKDREGVYLGCNNTVLTKGGFLSKSEVIGKTDYDLWPSRANEIREVDRNVMESGEVVELEESIILQDATPLYFSSVKAPLKDKQGRIIGVVGNSLDITELKKAQKNAEIASLAKTQFLALMSHEIRIPLTGIIGSASMLAEGYMSPEKVIQFSEIIQQSAQYLLSTLNNILDFAKLEVAQFEVRPVIVSLRSEIVGTTNLFLANAEQKGLSFLLHYDAELPEKIVADPLIIRHILTNLISNAIRYTEKGEVNVRIQRVTSTDQSVTIKIEVADTGIGMPPDKLNVIFDRFSQLENAYTRKQSRAGSGLGLSIVKKLVHLMKTDINVFSEPGRGSIFSVTIEFPLASQL